MRLLMSLAAVAALAGAVQAAQTAAVTITPGDYKLEWRMQASIGYGPFISRCERKELRKMDAEEIARFPGLVSADCRMNDGPLCVIIDESKGTGSGYDTLYYLPPSSALGKADFSRAIKMDLKKRDSNSSDMWAEGLPGMLDWPLGDGNTRLMKTAFLGSTLRVRDEEKPDGSRTESLVGLQMPGGWFGKVDTDQGTRLMWLRDDDMDGIYGGKARDAIEIGDEQSLRTYVSGAMHTMFAGKAAAYEGKLYSVELSRNGEAISFRSYEGDKGTLKIEASDSQGKPTECFGVYAKRVDGVFAVHGCFGSDLPVGSCECKRFLIGPDVMNASDGAFRFWQHHDAPIKIEKDKVTGVKLGGPITFDIRTDSNARIITARRGETIGLSVIPMIGTDRVEMFDQRQAIVTVKESSGRVVHTGGASRHYIDNDPYSSLFQYSVDVPGDWKPGLYTITATYAAKPYQDMIVGTKLLKVM